MMWGKEGSQQEPLGRCAGKSGIYESWLCDIGQVTQNQYLPGCPAGWLRDATRSQLIVNIRLPPLSICDPFEIPRDGSHVYAACFGRENATLCECNVRFG